MKKKIGLGLFLVLSMGSIVSASPANWSVRYAKGAPSSSQKYSDSVVYAINSTTSNIIESCTYATNPPDANGFIGYVTYTGKYLDSNGVYHNDIYPEKAHFGVQGSHNIKTYSAIPAQSMIFGDYQLHYYPGASAIFGGTYGS